MIKVRGLDKVVNYLKRAASGVPKALEEEMETTALLIEADAKLAAPVDTGKLRQSITSEVKKTFTGFSVSVSANAPYAMFIEFGTGGLVDVPDGWEDLAEQYKGKGIRQINLPAQPYLIPAYNRHVKNFMVRLQGQVRKLT
ncbi:hypothetical protein GCM10027299_21900 [Larkinella ripae]